MRTPLLAGLLACLFALVVARSGTAWLRQRLVVAGR
jgi:hypothetical protein